MKDKVLCLADPDSVHTQKWVNGWYLMKYMPIVSGISKMKQSDLIIKEDFNIYGGNGLIFLKNIFRFKKILNKVDPVIINPHFLTSYGFIGALLKRKNDFMVMSVHGTDIMKNMDRNWIYLIMAKFIFMKSNLIISVSENMTNKILEYFPYLKNKIVTQQYGVNIKLLNQYDSALKDILISTNRQWKSNSNYSVILKTLKIYDNHNLKLIGAYNDDYSLNLLSQYPTLQQYSTGLIPYEDNLIIISRSKIFISLPTSDGISLSLIEAIFLGAIPIVSDIKANRELIKDGINGFLVSIDAVSLKNAIDKVLCLDKQKVKDIQIYNKQLVLEKFDFHKNFQYLQKVLQEKGHRL